MQTAVRVALLTVCLAVAGCGLFGKRDGASNGGQKPFLGANPAASGAGAAAPNPVAATPQSSSAISGILAGQVMDRFNRRQPGAFIQVVDLTVPQQGGVTPAKIEVATDGQGYFTIQGLQPNRHYQLIARTKDGEKVLTGTALATPPNPRLSIYISDDLSSPTTPTVPPNTTIPGSPENKPAAAIDPPAKPKPEGEGTSTPPPAASVSPTSAADPSKVVVEPGGFARVIPPATTIPSPPTDTAFNPAPMSILPPPPTAPILDAPSPPTFRTNPPLGPTSQLPGAAPPVPYCVLVGRKLDTFALYDLNGQPWEFRRNHTGRLILIDFWYSTCRPCLQAIPHLVELQRQYGSYGLEVVGVAYEEGKVADQVQKVRSVRGRYTIPYTTLLGGGGPGPCPVKAQFDVHVFPTMILLDESGQIVWRGEGLDARQRWELENEIRRGLGIKPR